MTTYSGPGHWETITTTTYGTLTVVTATPHGLSVGSVVSSTGGTYQLVNARVTAVVNSTTFKVFYNSTIPIASAGGATVPISPTISRQGGICTANTSAAHGFNPGDMFTLAGVAATELGGGVSSALAMSNTITFTMATEHGLHQGDSVYIIGLATASFNGTWDVASIVSSTVFTVNCSKIADGTGGGSGGHIYSQWNDAKLFVISVPSSTTLTYRQSGADAVSLTTVGSVIPTGQLDGGQRNAVMMFQTRSGFITGPSFPIRLSTTGGKKLIASDVPVGPSNVVRRIIAFTAINGGKWFYLGVPARDSAGNVISTATVINDNTSTSAMFDFSDESLMKGSAIDIDGNNLFNLKLLGNCSLVALYADRLFWGGDENIIPNLQNMGFEGGTLSDGKPLGWANPDGLTVNTNGDFGDAVTLTAGKILSQNAYRDYWGVEIFKPATRYTFKCWARSAAGAAVTADLYDTATSTQLAKAIVTVLAGAAGSFYSAAFEVATPTITPSTVFRVYASDSVTIDELRVLYSEQPYNDRQLFGSYVINPESVDDLTGRIGASSGDPTAIMDTFLLMDPRAITEESANTRLYFLTENCLHTTKNLSGLEPSKWAVNQIADKCGTDSMFSAVSGEAWAAWASKDGARMFDGGRPQKVTQDIQDLWDTINAAAFQSVWSVNDPHRRRLFWGVPIGASTTPNRMIVLDYRYGESASDIEERASVKVSPYTGKMLVTDMSRKFTHWHFNAQCGVFIQTPHGSDLVFGDNNGRSYYLDPTRLHDDDYGVIPAYYVPGFSPTDEQEQALQLGQHRHLVFFLSLFIEGVGTLKLTPYRDSLSNPVSIARTYALKTPLLREMEIPQNVDGRRITYKIEAIPLAGSLDAHFDLSSMVLSMRPHPHSAVAGRV